MCLKYRPNICISQKYSESLYESPDLPIDARNSAALLASKVYYYLEEYDEALTFALGAGSAFQPDSSIPGDDEYIETLICGRHLYTHRLSPLSSAFAAKAIDRYIEARAEEQPGTQAKVDPHLQDIIESIFSHCIRNGEYKQVRLTFVYTLLSQLNARIAGHRYRSRISSSGHNRAAI